MDKPKTKKRMDFMQVAKKIVDESVSEQKRQIGIEADRNSAATTEVSKNTPSTSEWDSSKG